MAIGTGTALLLGAGAGLLGAGMQSSAARSAAQTQAQSAQQAAELQYRTAQDTLALQREMYEKGLGFQKDVYETGLRFGEPYREAGYGALTRIGELLPSLTAPVSREEILGLPGYQFAIEQGTGAARQGMNVGGGGSNVDRAAQKFAIDYTLGTAMPQVIAQRSNIYNTLAGIAGIGQTGTGQTLNAGQTFAQQAGQMGQQYGTNVANISGNTAGAIGQLGVGAGSALAAGQIGSANALAGGIGNIGNTALMYSLLQRQPASIPTPG